MAIKRNCNGRRGHKFPRRLSEGTPGVVVARRMNSGGGAVLGYKYCKRCGACCPCEISK